MKNPKINISLILVFCIVLGVFTVLLYPKIFKTNTNHLILNQDGSYGGSLNEELYGKGAPKNGEYDVKNSNYYTVNNDFYNLSSTEQRVIFPGFSSYQQTMQDSSGLACLLMVLNYMGEDVKKQYNELSLLNKYEEVTFEKVYENGTNDYGLINLIESLNLGITAKYQDFGDYYQSDSASMKQFFISSIKEGKFVFVRYQSPVGYKWKIVIGYDNLGAIKKTTTQTDVDIVSDDVIIFADPYDSADHNQDGYSIERFSDFFTWWCEMLPNGTINDMYSCVVVDPDIDINFNYQPIDNSIKQTLYDIHLPLNPDDTYGCSRNIELYGTISTGNGCTNHTDSNYYKINDFFNMENSSSRIILKNYTVLQQTMGSTCGICATNSVLSYYGHQDSQYDLEKKLLENFEKATGITVKGRGVTVNELQVALKKWNYTSEYNVSPKGSPKFLTYESYMEFMSSNLEKDKPIVVTSYLGSDHAITVIGLDDMGTDYIYDDVIIVADSHDIWDGYQDGYVVYSAYKFYSQHTSKNRDKLQSCLVIDKK